VRDRSALVFDDTEPDIDKSQLTKCDWQEVYPEAAEAVLTNAPELRGSPVTIHCFVDANHEGCHAYSPGID
jgi:hypothetical protein